MDGYSILAFVAPLHWGLVFLGWMAHGVFGVVLQLLPNMRRLLGKEDVGGVPAYKLRVTLKNGAIALYFLNPETFLPIKTVSKVSETGLNLDIDGYPTDYRKIDGIMFAHSIEQKTGSRSLGLMIYDKIEVNPPLDDNIFKMPIK